MRERERQKYVEQVGVLAFCLKRSRFSLVGNPEALFLLEADIIVIHVDVSFRSWPLFLWPQKVVHIKL